MTPSHPSADPSSQAAPRGVQPNRASPPNTVGVALGCPSTMSYAAAPHGVQPHRAGVSAE
eukprot:4420730-Pleurochrysis_carterae.AAC.1